MVLCGYPGFIAFGDARHFGGGMATKRAVGSGSWYLAPN